ncbi:hypothetical protein LINPERHAP1_LOCUS18286 [Linum perenne]
MGRAEHGICFLHISGIVFLFEPLHLCRR